MSAPRRTREDARFGSSPERAPPFTGVVNDFYAVLVTVAAFLLLALVARGADKL